MPRIERDEEEVAPTRWPLVGVSSLFCVTGRELHNINGAAHQCHLWLRIDDYQPHSR